MKNIEAEKFTRIWIMLENIPRFPKKVTVKELIDKLPDELKASPRTIQRDLEHLSKYEKWQLTSEKKGRTNYWSFTENSRLMAIPNMDVQTALAFTLVKKFSAKMLPLLL